MDGVECVCTQYAAKRRICAADANDETLDCMRHDRNVQQCGLIVCGRRRAVGEGGLIHYPSGELTRVGSDYRGRHVQFV